MRACFLDEKELSAAFYKVMRSSHLTEGHFVRAFEDLVSDMYQAHALALNSAGTALFAVMRSLKKRFRAGGTVIVPNNTFFATGAMTKEAGWNIALADCGEDFCLTVDSIKAAAAGRDVVGVVLTHIGGPIATEYAEIAALCKEKNWFLVEDAAHTFGVFDANAVGAGTYGDAAVFSFYPTKAVPVGEGGVAITRDEELAEEVARFRNYGKSVDSTGVVYSGEGFNFRMDEWSAAVAYLQTKRLDAILDSRHAAAWRLAKVVPVHPAFEGRVTNWYKYPVLSEYPLKRETGKIYRIEDQLSHSMGIKADMPMSVKVAQGHKCVPLHENMYEGWTVDEMRRELLV